MSVAAPHPAADPLVQLRAAMLTLQSAAGPVHILRGIDLSIAVGERVALVGPSGSGKTSLLMVVAGLEPATGGSVQVGGQELRGLSEDALARFRRDRIGVVFQNFHLIPSMSALENVAVPLDLKRVPDARRLAQQRLEAVGLGHRLHHFPAQLSGGEQQRVALARAFALQPQLLIADEPTGNLDEETGRLVIAQLFEMVERHGATLLLITHDARLAAACDRVLRVADGRIVEGPKPAAAAAPQPSLAETRR